MRVEVKVPQLPESVTEATLVSWHRKVGEAVARDENLIDVETDKVVLELPAPVAGVLVDILKADGVDGGRSGSRSPSSIPLPRRRLPRQPRRSPAAAAADARRARGRVAGTAAARRAQDDGREGRDRRRRPGHRPRRPRHQGRRARRGQRPGADVRQARGRVGA